MKFYFDDYVSKVQNRHITMTPACVTLVNNDVLFAFVKEIDAGVYFLDEVVKVLKVKRGENTILAFCHVTPFSFQPYMILKESSILHIVPLSEDVIPTFRSAVNEIYHAPKAEMSTVGPSYTLN